MEIDQLLNRAEASVFIRDQTGVQIAARSLERMSIPYRVLIGKAMYRRADLLRYVKETEANASRRMGGRGRRAISVRASA